MRIESLQNLTLCAVLFLGAVGFGLTKEHLEFQYESTSDNLIRRSLSAQFDSNRTNETWPYPDEQSSSLGFGGALYLNSGSTQSEDFQGIESFLKIHRKWNSVYSSELRLGVHSLENKTTGLSSTHGRYGITFTSYFESKFIASLSYDRNLAYQRMLLPKGLDTFLTEDALLVYLLLPTGDLLRSTARIWVKQFSDGNQKYSYDLESKIRLVKGHYWVWLGLGIEQIWHTSEQLGYWTPRRFVSFGPRLESAIPVVGKLQFKLSFNAHLIKEDNFPGGKGYYFSTGFQYGDRDAMHTSLNYIRIQSSQNNNTWHSDQLALSLTAFF